jgi:uncharacterized protein YegJ (DUF2314 family)
MRSPILLLGLIVGAVGGCSSRDYSAGDTAHREGEPDVQFVGAEDRQMNAAMAKARATIEQFKGRLDSPPPSQTAASLKARFEDQGQIEHMWLDDVTYAGGVFHGTIGNEPMLVTKWSFGDRVTVSVERVSDWMIADNGRLIGGWTIRVLRDRMSPQERADFDASLGLKIE